MYMKIKCVVRFAAEAVVIEWLQNIATCSLTTVPVLAEIVLMYGNLHYIFSGRRSSK